MKNVTSCSGHLLGVCLSSLILGKIALQFLLDTTLPPFSLLHPLKLLILVPLPPWFKPGAGTAGLSITFGLIIGSG